MTGRLKTPRVSPHNLYVTYRKGLTRAFSRWALVKFHLPRNVDELRERTRAWAESMPNDMRNECDQVIR